MALFARILKPELLSAALMLLMSCGGSNDQAILPSIETIRWQPDGQGFIQFSTNDPQYYEHLEWAAYSLMYEDVMTAVTTTVKKESGSSHSGYGVVFCNQDNNNSYLLLITTSGYYTVFKKVGGFHYDIIPWTTSSLLHTGLGVENLISVIQTNQYNFSVRFNGTEEKSFQDSSFFGGRAGFVASVSSGANENFPYTPEDVRFKLSSPVAYP